MEIDELAIAFQIPWRVQTEEEKIRYSSGYIDVSGLVVRISHATYNVAIWEPLKANASIDRNALPEIELRRKTNHQTLYLTRKCRGAALTNHRLEGGRCWPESSPTRFHPDRCHYL